MISNSPKVPGTVAPRLRRDTSCRTLWPAWNPNRIGQALPLLSKNALVILVLAQTGIQLQGCLKFLACLRLFPDPEQDGGKMEAIRALIWLLANRFPDQRHSRLKQLTL